MFITPYNVFSSYDDISNSTVAVNNNFFNEDIFIITTVLSLITTQQTKYE